MRNLKTHLSNERGAIAVVVAVCMLALLGVAAIAVDSGNNWQQRRQLTTAVEAAALAAAADYSWGDDGCTLAASDYLARNFATATLVSCTPHGDLANGTFGWVTVQAEIVVDQMFGGVLGQSTVPVRTVSHAMFGVPAVAGEGARPLGLCTEAVEDDAAFQAWQSSGTESAAMQIPYTSLSGSTCGYTFHSEAPTCVAADVEFIVQTTGDAFYDTGAGVFDITPDDFFKAGAVMSTDRIDLREDFAITFDVYVGARDSGADGIGFVFHNDPAGADAVGNDGGGQGMSGIQNSIGIEFDTWHNGEAHPGGPGGPSVSGIEYTSFTAYDHPNDLTLGYRFRPSATTAVTHLGAFDANGDGTLSNGNETTVSLWSDGGDLLRRVDVPANTPVEADGFAYVELDDPYTLNSGWVYRVAAENIDEPFAYNGSVAMASNMQFMGYAYAWDSSGNAFPTYSGSGSGYLGGSVKVQTYSSPVQAGDDPTQDHTAIYDVEHLIEPADYSEYAVLYGEEMRLSPLVTLPNIENDQWHTAIVTWDASAQELFYSFDGFTIGTLGIDLIADHIEGDYAHFGFGAATGAAKNRHRLRFTEFDVVLENPHPECTGAEDETGTVGGGNWSMIDFDGSTTDDSVFNDWITSGYGSDIAPGDYEGIPAGIDGDNTAALQTLVDSGAPFTIPMYTTINDTGPEPIFEVVAFATVKLTDFQVTGPLGSRFLEVSFVSGLADRACCIDIPTDGSYVETNQRATRIVALNSDGTPKRR